VAKNSDIHADRIRKVREGFQAGRITETQTKQLLSIFDSLDPQMASQVSDRTQFSVSTSSKMSVGLFGGGNGEARRQMARASLFLQDLQAYYSSGMLPTRTTDVGFESLWRSAEDTLRSQLQALAKALTDFDTHVREIAGADVPVRPKPVVGKLTIPRETQDLLNSIQRAKANRGLEAARQPSLTTAQFAWTNAKTRLIADFTLDMTQTLANIDSIKTAANAAYEEFEAFFAEQAAEVEFKRKLAERMFSALADYAPFPFSVVGKVGAAAVGMMHVDDRIRQTRESGQDTYFNSDIPALAVASQKLKGITDWKEDLTRLGVNGSSISSRTSIGDTLEAAKKVALETLVAAFKLAIDETYGDSPTQMADKSTEFYRGVEAMYPGAHAALLNTVFLKKITALSDATRAALRGSRSLALFEARTLQPYIELQLFAEFVAQLAPGEEVDVTIPDALVDRLSRDPFQLIVKKTGSGQSGQIYQAGKLPWQGHIRHKGALILFFRWYATKVNAFDVVVGRTTVTGLDEAMRATVREIGAAMDTHRVTRRLRDDTADWAKVSQAVIR
jgi:hypothetical protein